MLGQVQDGSNGSVALGLLIFAVILALQGVLIVKFLRAANDISALRMMVADWYEANLSPSGGGSEAGSATQTETPAARPVGGTDRYTLGSTETELHIWERRTPASPIRTYPRTEEGRDRAEAEWRRLEARLALLGAGIVLLVTAVAVAFLLPFASWIRVTVAGIGGILGLLLIGIGLAQGNAAR